MGNLDVTRFWSHLTSTMTMTAKTDGSTPVCALLGNCLSDKNFFVIYKCFMLLLTMTVAARRLLINNDRNGTDQGTVVSAVSTDKVVDSTRYTG